MKVVNVIVYIFGAIVAILVGVLFYDSRPAKALHDNVFDYIVEDILGRPHPMLQYKGHILLIMNVASECGFADKGYAAASDLYQKYSGEHNFTVLAFPCDQFGGQEPGDSNQIMDFAKKRNNPVTFPLMNKVNVNGPDASPLWEHLKNHLPGVLGTRSIKWNFSKFLVARDGTVRFRYDPRVPTEDIETDLQTLLYFRE